MKLSWTTEKRRVKDLIPAEYNPRQLTERQAKDLKKSLEKFDLVEIPAINTTGTIIAGHQRVALLTAIGRGDEEIDVRVPSRQLTDEEEKEYNLRSNKNTGEWDLDKLFAMPEDLLKEVGFDDKAIQKLIDGHTEAKEDDYDVTGGLNLPCNVSKGDVWQLGAHRLKCGDSTAKEDVESLMEGKKADMVFTDPPYNVDYGASKNPRHKIRSIENDKLDAGDWESFCRALFANFKDFCTGDIYMWGASGPEGMKMRLWLTEMGCHWSATIIWVKDRLVLTPANYQRKYEPCFYGWFDKSSWNGSRTETETWEMKRPSDSKLHPTMKPIEVCVRGIQNSSPANGLILDLFLGSGSTLIAAEQTGRICYGIEIDPKYCQVIIDRWEKLTGKKAVKLV